MTGLWETALAFLLISLAVLAFQVIFLILRAKDTVKRLNTTLDVLNKDLPEMMENLTKISGSVAKSSERFETAIEDIAEIEQIVSKEIKDPLKNIAQALSTILQLANRIFFRKSAKRKNGAKK